MPAMCLPSRDQRYQNLLLITVDLIFVVVCLRWSMFWGAVGLILSLILYLMNRFFWLIPTFPYDCILSARSDDGLIWNREDGVRLNVDDLHNSVQVYYPKVVKYKKGWRLYYRAGGRRAEIAALSKDGLNWIVEGGMRIASDQFETIFERVEGCDVTILENNKWQMYFSAFDGNNWRIYRSSSINGLNWQGCEVVIDMSSEGYLPDVKAPSVIRNKNEFRMYYTRFSKSESRIFTSLSDDGFNWSHSSECEDLCREWLCLQPKCDEDC